jgi:hypothetical protein
VADGKEVFRLSANAFLMLAAQIEDKRAISQTDVMGLPEHQITVSALDSDGQVVDKILWPSIGAPRSKWFHGMHNEYCFDEWELLDEFFILV